MKKTKRVSFDTDNMDEHKGYEPLLPLNERLTPRNNFDYTVSKPFVRHLATEASFETEKPRVHTISPKKPKSSYLSFVLRSNSNYLHSRKVVEDEETVRRKQFMSFKANRKRILPILKQEEMYRSQYTKFNLSIKPSIVIGSPVETNTLRDPAIVKKEKKSVTDRERGFYNHPSDASILTERSLRYPLPKVKNLDEQAKSIVQHEIEQKQSKSARLVVKQLEFLRSSRELRNRRGEKIL